MDQNDKLLVVMIGLPAVGKSYLCQQLCNHLTQQNINAQIFNIGRVRRQNQTEQFYNFNYYDSKNANFSNKREQIALICLNQCIQYLKNSGQVAFFDGTNSTIQRRNLIIQEISQNFKKYKILWLECICNDEQMIMKTIIDQKVNGPDYKNIPQEIAIQDFIQRIQNYKDVYQSIQKEEDIQYIKFINRGQDIQINNVQGDFQIKITNFLQNLVT